MDGHVWLLLQEVYYYSQLALPAVSIQVNLEYWVNSAMDQSIVAHRFHALGIWARNAGRCRLQVHMSILDNIGEILLYN